MADRSTRRPSAPPAAENGRTPEDSAEMRLAGGVMALTMLLWLSFQWLGGHYGLPVKYAFLADLAALAAMIWSLMVTWRSWRRRKAPMQR